VEMLSGAAAGRAHGAHRLAEGNHLAGIHADRAQMRVARLDAQAVIDLDRAAIGALAAREDHYARRRRHHRRAVRADIVDAGMEGPLFGEGVETTAEI